MIKLTKQSINSCHCLLSVHREYSRLASVINLLLLNQALFVLQPFQLQDTVKPLTQMVCARVCVCVCAHARARACVRVCVHPLDSLPVLPHLGTCNDCWTWLYMNFRNCQSQSNRSSDSQGSPIYVRCFSNRYYDRFLYC